jgi:hypothetical protein
MIIGNITGNENECAYWHSNPSHQNRAKGPGCKDFRTMARQVSWEPRLHEIRRSVANSVRSHYDRRDLELLFKLQQRAAGKLLETLRTDKSGRSLLIDRATLSAFLDGAHEAKDVAAYCAERREQRKVLSRRKPRGLVRRDFDPVPAASLSGWLTPGMLKVPYESLEELFDVLWRVASAMREDPEEFAQLYEAESPAVPESETKREVLVMFEELERMEREHSKPPNTPIKDTKRTPSKQGRHFPSNDALFEVSSESPTLRQKT